MFGMPEESEDDNLIIKAIAGLLASQEEMAATTGSKFREIDARFADIKSSFQDIEAAMSLHTDKLRDTLQVLREVGGNSADLYKKVDELQTEVRRLSKAEKQFEKRLQKLEEAS